MQRVDKGPLARAEGVRIAQEALLAAKDRVRGAYIMPALGRYEAAIEILEAIGYERPEAYRDGWRP
jgi:homocysteine S-methyltransferase